jgi:hypothetical protein
MACFLFFVLLFLLTVIAGVVALGWFSGKRVAWHLKQNPEAARELSDAVAEHVLMPLLTATEPPKEEAELVNPEPKKIKVTTI